MEDQEMDRDFEITDVLEAALDADTPVDVDAIRTRALQVRARRRWLRLGGPVVVAAASLAAVFLLVAIGDRSEREQVEVAEDPTSSTSPSDSTTDAPTTPPGSEPEAVQVSVSAYHDLGLVPGSVDLWAWVAEPYDNDEWTGPHWMLMYRDVDLTELQPTARETESVAVLLVPPDAAADIDNQSGRTPLALTPASSSSEPCEPANCTGQPTVIPGTG